MPPPGEWTFWLILAGRGYGKTRAGAETVRRWVMRQRFQDVNLIGATSDDVLNTMIEGPSGLMAICPNDERPRHIVNKRQLRWPNGSVSRLFSAEEPDRLRGKNHQKLWCDEIAAWRHSDAWDQAKLGLRIGRNPQAIITTTPRPIKLLKEIIADPGTAVTRGSTYDNRANLAAAFFNTVIRKYEGTRLGRQELNAEILEEVAGALWNRGLIDKFRVRPSDCPPLKKVVVAIDPAISSSVKSNETGIICVGLDQKDEGYVIDDASGQMPPARWAAAAIDLYRRHNADAIVGEVNQGGDLVKANIHAQDPSVPFRGVHASRGKYVRAGPIGTFYERGMVHHVGSFPVLEDQMCVFTEDYDREQQGSPDRVDALVWGLFDLMVKSTSTGFLDFYRSAKARAEAAIKGAVA